MVIVPLPGGNPQRMVKSDGRVGRSEEVGGEMTETHNQMTFLSGSQLRSGGMVAESPRNMR